MIELNNRQLAIFKWGISSIILTLFGVGLMFGIDAMIYLMGTVLIGFSLGTLVRTILTMMGEYEQD